MSWLLCLVTLKNAQHFENVCSEELKQVKIKKTAAVLKCQCLPFKILSLFSTPPVSVYPPMVSVFAQSIK